MKFRTQDTIKDQNQRRGKKKKNRLVSPVAFHSVWVSKNGFSWCSWKHLGSGVSTGGHLMARFCYGGVEEWFLVSLDKPIKFAFNQFFLIIFSDMFTRTKNRFLFLFPFFKKKKKKERKNKPQNLITWKTRLLFFMSKPISFYLAIAPTSLPPISSHLTSSIHLWSLSSLPNLTFASSLA